MDKMSFSKSDYKIINGKLRNLIKKYDLDCHDRWMHLEGKKVTIVMSPLVDSEKIKKKTVENIKYEINKIIVADDPNISYALPDLYMENKLAKQIVWSIYVDKNTVYKTHGQVGGKLQTNKRQIVGVSKGRSNSTTDEEQAIRVAERDWVNQLKKGYRPVCKKGKKLAKRLMDAKNYQGNHNCGVANLIRDGGDIVVTKSKKIKRVDNGIVANLDYKYETMQCQKWENLDKCRKYFDFEKGVYIQPKLDGIRCIAYLENDNVVFISRGKNQFCFLNHIRDQLKIFLKNDPDIILDGEFYADSIYADVAYKGKKAIYSPSNTELPIKARFNVIAGAIKTNRSEPHELESQIKYHVFDIVDPTGKISQRERFQKLRKLFKSNGCSDIVQVKTIKIYNIKRIETYHAKFDEMGYEGVIIRSSDNKYTMNRRVSTIRKHKNFIDKEFLCIGTFKDKGTSKEYFSWKCQDKDDDSIIFNATPNGTIEQRIEWYDNRKKYIGVDLTVKYQGVSQDGIPRFPKVIGIRDYE